MPLLARPEQTLPPSQQPGCFGSRVRRKPRPGRERGGAEGEGKDPLTPRKTALLLLLCNPILEYPNPSGCTAEEFFPRPSSRKLANFARGERAGCLARTNANTTAFLKLLYPEFY